MTEPILRELWTRYPGNPILRPSTTSRAGQRRLEPRRHGHRRQDALAPARRAPDRALLARGRDERGRVDGLGDRRRPTDWSHSRTASRSTGGSRTRGSPVSARTTSSSMSGIQPPGRSSASLRPGTLLIGSEWASCSRPRTRTPRCSRYIRRAVGAHSPACTSHVGLGGSRLDLASAPTFATGVTPVSC